MSNSAKLQLGFSPLTKTIYLAKMRDVGGDGMIFPKIAEKFEMPESTTKSIYYKRFTAADAIAREYLPR
ncbi:hypothetical protein SO383_004715 [Salmonella enterica]|nr:hypothetical protein [Salmonella enterica]